MLADSQKSGEVVPIRLVVPRGMLDLYLVPDEGRSERLHPPAIIALVALKHWMFCDMALMRPPNPHLNNNYSHRIDAATCKHTTS